VGIAVAAVVETGLAVVLKGIRIAGHTTANSKLVHLQLVHMLVVVVVVVPCLSSASLRFPGLALPLKRSSRKLLDYLLEQK
jgi:hypothetical protein